MKRMTLTLLTTLCILAVSACQSVAEPGELMELNRAGKWQLVKDSGLDHLEKRDNLSHIEICETYFNLIYSELRLGEEEEALGHMDEFKAYLMINPVPESHKWLIRELKKLEDELKG